MFWLVFADVGGIILDVNNVECSFNLWPLLFTLRVIERVFFTLFREKSAQAGIETPFLFPFYEKTYSGGH
ncbi:hypothetical protein [Neobacillus niacini]|uniref:hypothetical protein n=1 Tax=Neobacillus niacini TaxID=86668 RepID=UPI00286BFF78|nr:hypothetical protein [Neobacillus niacini]